MMWERRLEVELRRDSVAEGSSGLEADVEGGTSSDLDEGRSAGGVEEEGGLLSSAKCLLWRRNWHWMHVEARIEELTESCRVDLVDAVALMESNNDRDACLSSGCMAMLYIQKNGCSETELG